VLRFTGLRLGGDRKKRSRQKNQEGDTRLKKKYQHDASDLLGVLKRNHKAIAEDYRM
jgi:hypothetical protein